MLPFRSHLNAHEYLVSPRTCIHVGSEILCLTSSCIASVNGYGCVCVHFKGTLASCRIFRDPWDGVYLFVICLGTYGVEPGTVVPIS